VFSAQPPLLYNLDNDPNELTDLAKQKDRAATLEKMLKLAQARWPDLKGLEQRILKSQRDRRMVHAAMMKGKRQYWDFEPRQDAADSYIRNTGEALQDLEYICRAPYRGKRPRPSA